MSIQELTALSATTGVPLATIIKLRHGTTRNPRIATVQPLFEHFQRRQPSLAGSVSSPVVGVRPSA